MLQAVLPGCSLQYIIKAQGREVSVLNIFETFAGAKNIIEFFEKTILLR